MLSSRVTYAQSGLEGTCALIGDISCGEALVCAVIAITRAVQILQFSRGTRALLARPSAELVTNGLLPR